MVQDLIDRLDELDQLIYAPEDGPEKTDLVQERMQIIAKCDHTYDNGDTALYIDEGTPGWNTCNICGTKFKG